MSIPNPRNSTISFFLLLIIILFLPSTMAVTEPELDAAIAALRSSGYLLFGNAITASDVRLDLLLPANSSFTLFAPPDALIFSLDMAAPSAAAYVAALRLHVIPGRLTFPDLRSLPGDFPLKALLPGREIVVSRRRSADADFLTVDGVDVVLPGIFYSQDVAVHGLGGIISLRRPTRLPPSRSIDPPLIPPESGLKPFGYMVPPRAAPIADISTSRSTNPPVASVADISTSRSANPSVIGTPVVSPANSPTVSPDFSSLPPESDNLQVLDAPASSPMVYTPTISPEISPADAAALATFFSWGDWACKNDGAGRCTGMEPGWLGEWPRQQLHNDDIL